MKSRATFIVVAAALLGATPGHASTLDFDEALAPDLFVDSAPLTDQYAGLGVTWSGGGAVLNFGGIFGVNGFSPPNFLAYNDSSIFANGADVLSSDLATFSLPVSSVGFLVGANALVFPSNPSLAFSLVAYDAGGQQVDFSEITLTPTLQWIDVSGVEISRVTYGVSNGGFVVDSFRFLPVPEPSSACEVAFGLGLLSAGRAVRRRGR